MMKYFIVLCILYKSVYCFSCYACDSASSKGCQPLNPNMIRTIDCNKSNRKLNSQCVVYNYINQDGNVIHTKRKCHHRLTAATKSACDYVHREAEQHNFRVESCFNCTTDKCNSVELKRDSKDNESRFWKWYIVGVVLPAVGVLIIFLFSMKVKKRCCCTVTTIEPDLINSEDEEEGNFDL